MMQESRNWIARFSPPLVLALIACSVAHGQDVKSRYMPGTDFSKYRTYSWVRIEGAGYPDQIIDTEIMRSIDSQLVAKGLRKVETGAPDSAHAAGVPQAPALPQASGLTSTADSVQRANSAPKADLLIAYHVAIDRERQWTAFGSSFDRFPGAGWGTGTATATSSTVDVGTLVLNMYDPAAKQLVWAGSATNTISLSKKQEKNQKNLHKAMQKLLKDFPPTQR
jgi:hypothetical protein